MQLVAPDPLQVPAAHTSVQSEVGKLIRLPYLPGVQSVHTVEPSPLHVPAMHESVQSTTLPVLVPNFPALQLLQVMAAEAGW